MASFVAKRPHLSQLKLMNFKLTGQFLQSIVNPDKLVTLVLGTSKNLVSRVESTSQISAQTLQSLERFPNLTYLAVSGQTHTREHYKAIAGLKTITRLSLDYDQSVLQGLADLQTMPQLTMLQLDGTPLDDTHSDALAKFTRLESLSLRQCNLSKAGIQRLHKALPNCGIQSEFGTFAPKQ